MPWRNLPPDVLEATLNLIGFIVAGIVGTSSRIADEIARGDRKRVWGQELCVDITSFLVMVLIAAGLAEYMELSRLTGSMVSGILCRSGTPLLDKVIKVILGNISWLKK